MSGSGFKPCDSYTAPPGRARVLDSGVVVITVTEAGVLTLQRDGEPPELIPCVDGDLVVVHTLPSGQFSIQKL